MPRRWLKPIDMAMIAAGGILGATVRHLITNDTPAGGGWFEYAPNTVQTLNFAVSIPWRTVIVNLIGCALLGALIVMMRRSPTTGLRPRLLVAASTGFCGSLTTFATFATDAAQLLRIGDDAATKGVLYILISVTGGAAAFWAGHRIADRLAA